MSYGKEFGQDYNNPLTRSTADSLYCLRFGSCILETLTVNGNLTILGSITNVSFINVNVTNIEGLIPFLDENYRPIDGSNFTFSNTTLVGNTTIQGNLTVQSSIFTPDDQKHYFGTDKDVYIMFNSTGGYGILG